MRSRLTQLRLAVRTLRRHALFTTVAVSSIALGVAGATFLAWLYSQVALRPLPVPEPERLALVALQNVAPQAGAWAVLGDGTYDLEEVDELAAAAAPRASLAAWASGPTVLEAGGGADRVDAEWVTPGYFETLGLRPAAGRLFDRRDAPATGGGAVAVLSARAFRLRFGDDPAAIGAAIRVDGRPVIVVGVAPAPFRSVEVGDAPELFLLAAEAPSRLGYFRIVARLAPGASTPELEGTLRATLASIRARHPDERRFSILGNETVEVSDRIALLDGTRGRSPLRGTFSRTVVLVGAMFAVVLLVLAANLANLLAARAVEERRATAIRLALGADRRRIALDWLAESAALALAGTAAGLLAALVAAPRLLKLLPVAGLDAAFELRFDGATLAVAAGVALTMTALVGALGALEATRADATGALAALRAEGAGSTADRAKARWRWTLVGAQVALSVVLLVGMGLLVRTLGALLAIDTRLPLGEVLSFRLDLPSSATDSSARELLALREELARLPGVTHAAYASNPALAAVRGFSTVSIDGYRPAEGETMLVPAAAVSPDFFETLDFPIVRGRSYRADDAIGAPRAVVVNRRFIERYLPGVEPLGRRISFDSMRADWERRVEGDLEIVGVVADGRLTSVTEEAMPRFFPLVAPEIRSVSFFVRAAEPRGVASGVRELVRARLPEAALTGLDTLERQRDRLLAEEHFLGRLSAGFGLLTTLLAALGLYGVLAYTTGRRRREIALRMALGARGADIGRLVARDAALALAGGAAVGFLAAWPAARLLESFLYGVKPGDPLAFAGALAVLLAAAIGACWLPARRSIRLDPAPFLRAD